MLRRIGIYAGILAASWIGWFLLMCLVVWLIPKALPPISIVTFIGMAFWMSYVLTNYNPWDNDQDK